MNAPETPTPNPHPPDLAHDEATEKMELALAKLLRAGVAISIGLIFIGLCVSFFHHPHFLYDDESLPTLVSKNAKFPNTVTDIFLSFPDTPGRSIMDIGLLVLLITPILRVAVSAIVFAFRKDWRFAAITGLVLIILLVSILSGHTESAH